MPLKERLKYLPYLPGFIFHVIIVIIILRSFTPFRFEMQTDLLNGLFSGSNLGYILPGSEMEPFKKVLPPDALVTFLTDHAAGVNIQEERTFNDARLYLAPIIVNPEPAGRIAIVYCSSQETADRRLQETGYQWTGILAPGKGLAVKK